MQRAPRPGPAHLRRQGQGRGAARGRPGDRLRHRGVRQRAHPGPAAQPREAARPHRHRPHRGDPRHLRPERPQPGGQGAGRAGPAQVPAAAHPGQGHGALPAGRRHVRRRGPHRHPRARARPSSRSIAAASSGGSTSSRPSCARSTSTGPRSARPSTAAACSAWPSSATRTPASPRCSTASPTPACSWRTASSPPSTPPPAASTCPAARRCSLTDTVGFIRKLPHQLVEAFKSTLSVAADADLLVHVVDCLGARPRGQHRGGAHGPAGDRRRRRARAPRLQQGRPRAQRGQPGWPSRTTARWPSAPPPATASRSCCRTVADRLRAPHQRGRAGHPLRPGRRAGRRAPRGRGARRAARRRRPCGCGSGSTTPRSATSSEYVVG